MSGKVISMAERRKPYLALLGWSGRHDGPINGPFYDLWVQADGSVILRFHAERVTFCDHGLRFGEKGDARSFEARPEAYEVRIAQADIERLRKDITDTAWAARRRIERQRGDHLWICVPLGDGTYTVRHERQEAVFEPFKPKLRRKGTAAPRCSACTRVVQIGETMYRERPKEMSHAGGSWHSRTFHRTDELCAGCIERSPNDGISEVR